MIRSRPGTCVGCPLKLLAGQLVHAVAVEPSEANVQTALAQARASTLNREQAILVLAVGIQDQNLCSLAARRVPLHAGQQQGRFENAASSQV